MTSDRPYTPLAGAWLETIGWLTLFGGCVASILLTRRLGGLTSFSPLSIYLGVVFVSGTLYIVAGRKVKEFRWRTFARVLAAFMILSFPVWTIFGLVVMYYLWKGSHESANDPPRSPLTNTARKAPRL
jgi:hypothetical protein